MHSFKGAEAKSIKLAADYFNFEHKDIHLILIQEDGETVLKQVLSGDKKADLFIWAHDVIGKFAEKNRIVPIDKFITAKDSTRFISTAFNAMEYKKKTYGLPLSIETLLLFYNKKYVSEPPKTLNELMGKAKSFSDFEQRKYGLLFPFSNYYFNAMFTHSFGGATFKSNGSFALNSAAQKKALEYITHLIKEKVLPFDMIKKTSEYISLFNSGNVLFFITGPWDVGSLTADYEAAKLPINDKTNMPIEPFLGVKGIYLLRTSKHKAAAIEVMRYLTSAKMEYIMSFIGGEIPANLRTYNFDEIRNDKLKMLFKAQALDSVPMPNLEKMKYVWDIMNTKNLGNGKERKSIYERALQAPNKINKLLNAAQRYCEKASRQKKK